MKKLVSMLNNKKVLKDTDALEELFIDNEEKLTNFYIRHGFKVKNAELINGIHKALLNKKFVKMLKNLGKNTDWEHPSKEFVVIINNMIEKKYNDGLEQDIIEFYSNIIKKILKNDIKEIYKKTDIDKSIIQECLVVVPSKTCLSSPHSTRFYFQRMVKKLYYMYREVSLDDIDTKRIEKKLKKFLKAIFGNKLMDIIAVNILLEKKDTAKNFNDAQKLIWDSLLNIALSIIDEQDKKHITELIEYYCNCRKDDAARNRDSARRINLLDIDADEYPALVKRIKKFEEDGKESLVKFL